MDYASSSQARRLHLVHLEPSADEKFRAEVAPERKPQAKSHKRTPQDTDRIRTEHVVVAASRVPFI